jgi:hypothetical protein
LVGFLCISISSLATLTSFKFNWSEVLVSKQPLVSSFFLPSHPTLSFLLSYCDYVAARNLYLLYINCFGQPYAVSFYKGETLWGERKRGARKAWSEGGCRLRTMTLPEWHDSKGRGGVFVRREWEASSSRSSRGKGASLTPSF